MGRRSTYETTIYSPRRIGAESAAKALPPQPARFDVNPNREYRRAYVHAFIPGRADLRLGPDSPALARAREALTEAGANPDDIAALTLDELLVLPDEIIVPNGELRIRTTINDKPRASAPKTGGGVELTGEFVTADLSVIWNEIEQATAYADGSFVPAPCVIREISGSLSVSSVGGPVTVTVSGFGTVLNIFNPNDAIPVHLGGTGLGLNRYVMSGVVQPSVYAQDTTPSPSINLCANFTVICELLRRV